MELIGLLLLPSLIGVAGRVVRTIADGVVSKDETASYTPAETVELLPKPIETVVICAYCGSAWKAEVCTGCGSRLSETFTREAA